MNELSRREFVGICAIGADQRRSAAGPSRGAFRLDGDWLFGGKFSDEATKPEFNDTDLSRVSLPSRLL